MNKNITQLDHGKEVVGILGFNQVRLSKPKTIKYYKISGATSQTPSIISGHSDLSAIVSEFSEHIPDFQNTTVVPAHHPGQQPPSDAQLAAQQASVEMQQMFDFQDEEGLATGIPKLIGYLKSNDTVVVRQASQVIHQFSKREHLKVALITNRDIIPSLILVLGNTNDPETAR